MMDRYKGTEKLLMPDEHVEHDYSRGTVRSKRRSINSKVFILLTLLLVCGGILITLGMWQNREYLDFKHWFAIGSNSKNQNCRPGYKVNDEQLKLIPSPTEAQCDVWDDNARFDCDPEKISSQEHCLARGCCWRPVHGKLMWDTMSMSRQGDIAAPWCYFPKKYPSYSVHDKQDTNLGYTASLTRTTPTSWPDDVMNLKLDMMLETQTRLHFKIYDPANARYEVPLKTPKVQEKTAVTDYDVKINEEPFGITVSRKSTGAVLFNTALPGAPLIFADQFIQISTHSGSGYIYGLGERMHAFLQKSEWHRHAFWTRVFILM